MTWAATVSRPRSGNDSVPIVISLGPLTSCAIAQAIRSLLIRVLWTRTARGCLPSDAWCSSLTSGDASTAAARGSVAVTGTSSLATISESTTRRRVSSTGLTVYLIAATARWVSDTSRTDSTWTVCPAGEVHTTVLVRVPARRSRVRVCDCTDPYLMSNGSSFTSSRITLPLVTLMTVWPSSGNPYPASAYGSGLTSYSEFRYVPGSPYGSPSSRLPRRPMCPLDRAKTDSLCASRSRSTCASVRHHGSAP